MLCLFRCRSVTRGRSIHSSVVLRPYQESCLEACTDALRSGASRIGVSLPTGSGKTTVFISLLSRISPPQHQTRATKSLVIVNSVELARQAAAQTEILCPDWSVEIEQGPKHRASGLADVTVATYQTLLQPSRLAKFNPKLLKAIIVDEAHHAAAPSYRRILSHFHEKIKHPDETFTRPALTHAIPILGFSATFSRHDGLALGSVFERIVYHRDFLEMIKEEWLCNVRFTSVKANLKFDEVTVNSKTGDFNPTSLAHVINTPTINELVVQTWLDRAGSRKSTLVFCVNLEHVRQLTDAFRAAGIDARYVYSGTPAAERHALISGFKLLAFPVLVNCAILTEGADIPNIDCVIVARPTRSRNLFAQMIGRGMRLSPQTGKEDCRIIDFVDSVQRVSGVISIPTLFGLDPSEVIDDEPAEVLEEKARQEYDPERSINTSETSLDIPRPHTVTYTDHEDPFSFIDQSSGAPHIRSLSRNAWVGCGDDVYILECMGKGFIKVERVAETGDEGGGQKTTDFEGFHEGQEHWQAVYTPPTLPRHTAFAMKISPYQRSRRVLTANTLADAVRGCDTYAAMKVVQGVMARGLLRTAKWRHEPATDNQKAFIRNRFSKRMDSLVDRPSNDPKNPQNAKDRLRNMSKGEAANIISRLKHGAQVRYEKKFKQSTKAAAAQEKERQRRAREHVGIGPLLLPD